MSQASAPIYPQNVTYNFAQWGLDQPVRLSYDGQQYFGYLRAPAEAAPYRVLLTERFENGASRRLTPREVELQSLDGVRFMHVHGH